ncbi:hypothetical protein EIP86_004377 [Pleurotus ostreatoroseus]|nr:hypothetical protein EIP86_004377 [Pleurotus ostreatoroseus]
MEIQSMLLHLLSTALLSKKLAEHGSRNSVSYYHVPSLHTSTDLKCLTDKIIPRQLFEVPIQATVGKKVIARETLSAMRADVTAGLYGGHYERKLKHLENQKEGKRRMKRIGRVDLPQEAFFEILSSKS